MCPLFKHNNNKVDTDTVDTLPLQGNKQRKVEDMAKFPPRISGTQRHIVRGLPWTCDHCKLIFYGGVGDLIVCDECYDALHAYMEDRREEALFQAAFGKGSSHTTKLSAQELERAWIADSKNKPHPEKRYHRSIPPWLRKTFEAGLIKMKKGREEYPIYVVYTRNELPVQVEVLPR